MFLKFLFLTLLAGVFLCLPAVWEPPATSLPEKFITATGTLFDQGLADPRDGEYRQIEVVVGSVWGGSGVCKIHGWVLPNKSPNQSERFGIAWNGLIYPLVSVGEPADMNDDVLKLIKQDEDLRARYKLERPGHAFRRLHAAIAESSSVSHETLLPLKASLLLRLGHIDLAEKVWSAWSAGTQDDDPYLILSTHWVWALFDRAVTAHMRGDHRLSLQSARSLPAERTRFAFLKPLTQLLADEERRVRDKADARKQAVEETLRIQNPRDRTDALIQHLDEVVALQTGQPGGVDLSESEIVKALIAQGEAAVEPLLNVIENDTRLTRSVSFGRDFHFDRHLIGVHEAAYAALVHILKTSNFITSGSQWETMREGSLDKRRALAAQIRQYLKEYGGLSLEERWYRILSNDDASADQWLEAVEFIVQSGEALRIKANPTVSELLIRRMRDLAQRGGHESSQLAMQKVVTLALALGTWDGRANNIELRRLMSTLVEQHAKDASKRSYLIGQIVSLTLKRSELDDNQALTEYAAWLQTVRPADTEYSTVLLFEPALRYPNAPDVARAIDWMFSNVSSPWVPLIPRKVDYYNIDTAKLIEQLLNFAAFREQVLKNLEDQTVVGTLVPRPASPDDKYDLTVENNIAAVVAGSPNTIATVVSIGKSDANAPRPPLQPRTFRVCDVYAWKLRGYEGAPRIEVYWTEPERDAAVAEFVTFLRTHKGPFVYSPERAYKYTQ